MTFKESFLNLIAPQKCVYCRKVTQDGRAVCPECEKEEEKLLNSPCPVCGEPRESCTCPNGRDGVHFLFYYNSKPIYRAVSAVKYKNSLPVVSRFAKLSADRLKDLSFDCIVYVPRSKKAIRRYGFDQGKLAASCLAKELSLPVCAAIKRKDKKQREQKLLDSSQRHKNAKEAFEKGESLPEGASNILLTDDVCTTGSTLNECVRLLKKENNVKVTCAVIAKTPSFK